jgi:acetyl esterase/lipase
MPSPELEMVVAMMRARPDPEILDPVAARASLEALTTMAPMPEDVACQPVRAGGVPAEWVTAPGAGDRVVLYLHGGGYVIGSINSHRDLAGRLSRAAGARVLVLDYRLAPEHPFPAAVDDALAAYRWLLAEGHTPRNVAIGGDSAGGGLTLATLVALRDAGETLPAAGVCLSPWTDLAGSGESLRTKADADPMVQWSRLAQYADAYLGGKDARTPLASPLYADLRGLPPLLIQVGTAETLLDDAIRVAERAEAAGVDVTYEAWDDMIHVFQAFAALLPEGQQAVDRIGAFVRARCP